MATQIELKKRCKYTSDIVKALLNRLQWTLEDTTEFINSMEDADVVEVKYGEWIPVQYTYFGLKRYECSECKDDDYWQKRYLEHKEKYCPNCGAKMDLE